MRRLVKSHCRVVHAIDGEGVPDPQGGVVVRIAIFFIACTVLSLFLVTMSLFAYNMFDPVTTLALRKDS